jgi:hypothetical protein
MAIEMAIAETAARYEKVGKKRAKGSTTRKAKKVARIDYGARNS